MTTKSRTPDTSVKRKKSSSHDSFPDTKKLKVSSKKATASKKKIETEEEEYPSSSEDEDELEVDNENGGSDSSDEENNSSDWGSDSDSDSDSDNEESSKSKSSKKDGDNEENDDENQNENGLSSKESHAKQKKIKEERKMAKPNAETIQTVKQLWERLRVKKGLTADARKKLINEAWGLSKKLVCEIALKHDTSRVVQTMIKYSDKNIRKEITNELKPIYYKLATSSYGKYLIIKLLHYGNQETRDEIFEALFDKGVAEKLMRHKDGAYVLEDMFRLYASPKYRQEIINQFFDIRRTALNKDEDIKSISQYLEDHPEKRPDVMTQGFRKIQSAVEKGSIGFYIIHSVMLNYIKNLYSTTSEKDNFVDLITEQIAEIVHTPDGSETASRIFAISNAKERKLLIRTLRKFVFELASDEHGCFVLISLFDTVDDTVLVKKAFTEAFQEHMPGLLTSKSGRRPFLYLLLGPSTRYFSKEQIKSIQLINELKKDTSKKRDEDRLRENLESFSPFMLETIQQYPRRVFEESVGSQTAVEVLLYAAGDKTAALEAVANTFKGSIINEQVGSDGKSTSLFSQPFVSRALRTLIQGGHWNAAKKAVDVVPEERNAQISQFKYMLANAIDEEYISDWATSDASFVIISLLEYLDKDSDEYKNLEKSLKKVGKKIKKAAEKENNKGSKLILEILKL